MAATPAPGTLQKTYNHPELPALGRASTKRYNGLYLQGWEQNIGTAVTDDTASGDRGGKKGKYNRGRRLCETFSKSFV